MLTYGATSHFIVPELDAGCQIIYQSTFMVPPGTPRDEIIRRGQQDNEPHCLVEGVRRVVDGEVQLHFNRVVARNELSRADRVPAATGTPSNLSTDTNYGRSDRPIEQTKWSHPR